MGRVLAAIAVALLAAAAGLAATPCTDEPGFAGLSCRIAALAEAHPADARITTLANRLSLAAQACADGRTEVARRKLRLLGSRLRTLRALGPDVQLLDALRRATEDALARHPCPELFDVLSPAGPVVAAGDAFVLLRLAADADPATLEVTDEAFPVALDSVSATQAWGRVPCPAGSRHALLVRVQDRTHTVARKDVVKFACGPTGVSLGERVDVLVDEDHSPRTLRLTPVRPLKSGATYALVVTDGLRTPTGVRFAPSPHFAAAAGLAATPRRGPAAHWTPVVEDPENPFPDERLLRADGTVRIPDGFTARALPADARLDGVRAFLRGLDLGCEEHHGFSPNTPVVATFDAPVRLDTATSAHVFLVEVVNPGPPGTNLAPLLAALDGDAGVPAASVVLASVFPVEDVAGTLVAVRAQVVARAAASPPVADFADPNPGDARRYGIFRPGDADFATFFSGTPPPSVGAVARGSFPSPEYREHGRFPARFLDGSAVPPHVALEFLLAVPAIDAAAGRVPPFPTVILQHGFGGDDTIVTQHAGELTARGLAVIGVPAPEHGPRGSFLDFFDFDDFNAFGNNFRQASVDLLALTRLIEAGVDLDGDGASELRATDLAYLGVSLGGVIGGVFAAVEPAVTAAVLNVPGGRLSQIAGASSPLAEPFLARFAAASGIPVRTCGGTVGAPACTVDATCAGAPCLRNPDFDRLLDAAALDWQTQLDPGDGASYARRLRIEPEGRGPKAVLVQEGIGDVVVTNPLTEALVRAIGLPADRADAAPAGVAGLWRFPPPAGHGILGLPEVRGQAFGFLASGGTVLAAP